MYWSRWRAEVEGRRLSDLPLVSGESRSLLSEAFSLPLSEWCLWSVASEMVVGDEGSEASDEDRVREDSFKEEEPGRGVLPRMSRAGEAGDGREVSGILCGGVGRWEGS